jgi:hypothetical protein
VPPGRTETPLLTGQLVVAIVGLVAVAELKDRSPNIEQHDVRTFYPGALMVIRRPPASFPMMAVALPVTVIE